MYVDDATTLAYVDVYVNGLCVLIMVRQSPRSIFIDTTLAYVDFYVNGLCVLMIIRYDTHLYLSL